MTRCRHARTGAVAQRARRGATGASGRSRDDDGASAQSADDFCSRELAERRLKGWYIRKTDHGGDWRGPYSTIASVSLMIARELGKELARRDALAGCD